MIGIGERLLDRALDSRAAAVVAVAGALAFGAGSNYAAGQLADAMYGSGEAAKYLEQSGYTDPELESVNHMLVGLQGCSKTDTVQYEFEATAVNGERVDIDVCKGILKGATIRQG